MQKRGAREAGAPQFLLILYRNVFFLLIQLCPSILLLSGPTAYHETYTLAHLPDDMTVGLTIGKPLK